MAGTGFLHGAFEQLSEKIVCLPPVPAPPPPRYLFSSLSVFPSTRDWSTDPTQNSFHLNSGVSVFLFPMVGFSLPFLLSWRSGPVSVTGSSNHPTSPGITPLARWSPSPQESLVTFFPKFSSPPTPTFLRFRNAPRPQPWEDGHLFDACLATHFCQSSLGPSKPGKDLVFCQRSSRLPFCRVRFRRPSVLRFRLKKSFFRSRHPSFYVFPDVGRRDCFSDCGLLVQECPVLLPDFLPVLWFILCVRHTRKPILVFTLLIFSESLKVVPTFFCPS